MIVSPTFLTLTAALLLAVPAWAQLIERLLDTEPLSYVAYRALSRIEVDGRLDEPSWQRVPWTGEFIDIEGADEASAPPLRTRAKMIWDDDYFYVAADIEEPQLWASVTERDDFIYHDNDFEVFIDPDGDTHEYYEYEINAFGTSWDLFLVKPYRDGGPFMSAWDIKGMKKAVQVWGTVNDPRDEDEGWTVELAFPWSVLKECAHRPAPPRDGDQWRVNLIRVQWPLESEQDLEGYAKIDGAKAALWVWSPQGLMDMHYPEQWGFVQFSSQRSGSARVSFEPPPEREARRLLREIYYRQRQFHQRTGAYADSLAELGIGHRILRDFLWPPQMQATDHMFEASLEEVVDLNEDGKISRWLIRHDSKAWKEEAGGRRPQGTDQ